MANINFIIPDQKLQRIIDAMKFFNPIPEGEEGNWTDAQWTKKVVRRWIISQTNRCQLPLP